MNLKSQEIQNEIEHDAFVEGAVKGYEFLRKNQWVVIGIAAVVAAGILLGLYFIQSSRLKEARSSVLVNRGTEYFNQENFSAASGWFQQALDTYAGTTAANDAIYFLGVCALREGDFSEARERLENFIGMHPANTFMLAAAHAGIASCFEQDGNWDEAAQNWAEAGLMPGEDNFNASSYLFNAALCYERAGSIDKARPVLERLLEKYPQSSQKTRAELILERFNAMEN
jgi:tetratricopeptide (TPR) repeat protein